MSARCGNRVRPMASGWWDADGAISGCVVAYQPVGAASLAASYSNLANPGTYDCTARVAPTFAAATGWTFGGTGYLNTGWIPPGDGTCSVIVRVSNGSGTASQAIFGLQETDAGYVPHPIRITPQDGFGGRLFYNKGSAFTYADGALTSGVAAIAGNKAYMNGSLYLTLTGGANFTYTKDLAIGGSHYYEPGYEAQTGSYIGNILAIACYTSTLTAGEIATISTAMAALTASSQSIVPHLAAHKDWWHG